MNIRSWQCSKCNVIHDRDINAAKNIALEAKRLIAAGTAVTANGGNVRKARGRKTSTLSVANEVRSSVL